MRSIDPAPQSGQPLSLSRVLRCVTRLSERRYLRILERNEEWAEEARSAPTVRESLERRRR
jgi:hypothetical protein